MSTVSAQATSQGYCTPTHGHSLHCLFWSTANRPDPEGPQGEQELLLSWQIHTTSSSTAMSRIAATCYRKGGGGGGKKEGRERLSQRSLKLSWDPAEQQTTTTSSGTTTSTKELNVQYGGRDTQTDQGH